MLGVRWAGTGQGGRQLPVLPGLRPAAAAGSAWNRRAGKRGSAEGDRETHGGTSALPAPHRVVGHPPPMAWGNKRAIPWRQGGGSPAGLGSSWEGLERGWRLCRVERL